LNPDKPGVDSELRDEDRLHETTQVCGSTIKEIIHEMFGDGIMSAIDFEIDIQKEEDPRVIA
jgi:cyanate lyase